jgi:hypothetical protein
MKYLLLLFLFCTLFSCKKDFANFQQSQYSTYAQSSNNAAQKYNVFQPDASLSASLDNSAVFPIEPHLSETLTIEVNSTNKIAFDKIEITENKGFFKYKKAHFQAKMIAIAVSNQKNTIKQKFKPVPLNSTIYTGFIILGIAIVLALVSLESLSLLFGLAAIVLLYIGFKKYLRRKKWRDIFR